MNVKDKIRSEIENLPEETLAKVLEFISFQKFAGDLYESDQEYLSSIPGMKESIKKGIETPIDECEEVIGWDIS